MAGSQAAREAARLGRLDQLSVLKDFEEGKTVTFKVHNRPAGYKLTKADLKPAPPKDTKVKFQDGDVLHDVVTNGDMVAVNKLLDRGVDPNLTDPDGLTALHRACTENYLNIASALVAKGADIKAHDNDWWTPLHAAANSGNWRICNLLLTNGADVLAVNAEGDLPIDLVSDTKVEGVIQREMESKGIKTEDEIETVRESLAHQMLDDLKHAVQNGVDLNKRLEFGATYLHVACCNGFNDVVQFLLEQPGINPNVADNDGNTPLHLAVFFCQYESVMYLVAKGADLQAKNSGRLKPIIMSEDQTMIRLITALEKKTQQVKAKLGAAKPKYAGSISRSTRAKKQGGSRRDKNFESSKTFSDGSGGD